MLPELPETYYHNNVLTLFRHVETLYADLLDAEMLDFLDGFTALDANAQKLYIRLLNRSHDWFRLCKLSYREIDSIEHAIAELADRGRIRINGPIEPETLLTLFTKAELVAASGDRALSKLLRGDLTARLLEDNDDRVFESLRREEDLIQVMCRDQYRMTQMLFFGNLNQSMTDFVLRDLGLYQFEKYRIDPQQRPYRDAAEIAQHWFLHRLEAEYESIDLSDTEALQRHASAIPDDIDSSAPAFRKAQRLRGKIARQIERNGELDLALSLYGSCHMPPARERIARILAQQDKPGQALDRCAEIIRDPVDESEAQFASQFATRLAKRHDLDPIAGIRRHRKIHHPEVEDLELPFDESVELAVASYYNALEGETCCHYLENTLFKGVLGLLLWDVIFAPVPGAFFNPFQQRPSDFYAADFCQRRDALLRQLWSSIRNTADMAEIVTARWNRKHGLMNPLVNWPYLDLDLIRLALERIEFDHWRAIFERMLLDLRNNRAGFPDLAYFPSAGGYCLIEVKGPGDTLQKNQQRWMHYFGEHGIPHRLTRVKWTAD